MRITYIHQYFCTPSMPGSTRSYEFTRRLVARGHEVNVITSDRDMDPSSRRSGWRTTNEAGATVHWVSVPYENAMAYRRRLRAFGRFAVAAMRRAASLEHDVVFATSAPLTVALPGVYASSKRRVPLVLEVRDLWPTMPIAVGALRSPWSKVAAWKLESWAYRHAAHVVALSPDMSDDIRARFPEVPVTVVPNSCDIDAFSHGDAAGRRLRESTPWLGDRPMILYAGTLGIMNDIRYLVRMAVALRRSDPDIRIVVVGDGHERASVQRLAAELGVLSENLFFVGPVPKASVVEYFAACDLSTSLFINIPEMFANSANKFFDALAAGRPVAVNHGGWISEVIDKHGAGIVLPIEDPEKGATMVSEFISDPVRVEEASRAASRLARDHYSRDLLFERFEGVLLNAAGLG